MRISELIKGLDAWADDRISDIDITDITFSSRQGDERLDVRLYKWRKI